MKTVEETKKERAIELQETLLANPHIKEVHYTAKGDHYFQVHSHGGEKYGRIHKETLIKDGAKKEVFAPILSTKIVKTVDADEIKDPSATAKK